MVMCSTETPNQEISSEQCSPSQEGARARVADLPQSVHMKLKLSISPFFPLFIYHHSETNLEGNNLILSESIQKGRKGLPNCVLTFFDISNSFEGKRKKETKQKLFSQDFSAFCFLWLRKIRLQRSCCCRTKACLPSSSFSELCSYLKAILEKSVLL